MSEKVLFIGGCCDGKKLPVSTDSYVALARGGGREIYTRRAIYMGHPDNILYYFAPENWTDEHALLEIFAGYAATAKPEGMRA